MEALIRSQVDCRTCVTSTFSTQEPAFPGVRQHLTREMGRALAGLQRSLQQGRQFVIWGQDIQRITDSADDSHQQIVEIVSHAAGQYPDALEFLAMVEHLLRTALVLHDR